MARNVAPANLNRPSQTPVTYLPINALSPHPNNPRRISKEALAKLCDSLRDNPELFAARPIIASKQPGGVLLIIAGSQRHKAAAKNGLKEVPVVVMEGLSLEKEREIMVRDNVNAGEWDWEALADAFDTADLDSWGLPMDIDFGMDDEDESPTEPETPQGEQPSTAIASPPAAERAKDNSQLSRSAETYLNSSIRQIVLYYNTDQHAQVLARLTSICAENGLPANNSAAVLFLLDHFDQTKKNADPQP